MKRRILNLLKAIIAAAIFAVLCWKGLELANQQPDALTLAVIVITALGVTYSASAALFRAIKEMTGGFMVLADFLTQHLLEPLKERQREQGREQGIDQGRQAERDSIRAQLLERGVDLDELLRPDSSDERDG